MKFDFITVYIPDLEKSLAFYHRLLRLEILRRFPIENGGEIAFLGVDGQPTLELIASPSHQGTAYTGFSIGVAVDSLADATRLLEAEGFPLVRGPISPGPASTFSFFRDPDGIEVQLIEHHQV